MGDSPRAPRDPVQDIALFSVTSVASDAPFLRSGISEIPPLPE